MTPAIKVIEVNSDIVICSLQIQDGSGAIINPWKVERAAWVVEPEFMFQAITTPELKDIERKVICPAHTEPVVATVTIDALIDILDGKGPQPYWTQTKIIFKKVASSILVLNVVEA